MSSITQAEKRGLVRMVAIAVLIAVANSFLAALVNYHNREVMTDSGAVGQFVNLAIVVWALFTAAFYARTDEEWKKVNEAVVKGDEAAFHVEVIKKIGFTFRLLYILISVLLVLSFYFFHMESWYVTVGVHFMAAFLVSMSISVILDMDDPVKGVINVPGVSEEWLKRLPNH